MTEIVESLNAQYGGQGRIHFSAGPGGFVLAELINSYASATVALEGGQILAYTPHGQPPVLFLSKQATYTHGKSVRGGIPVCWPWFAGMRDNPQHPFHGFARMLRWDVRSTSTNGEVTLLELGLQASAETRSYWPHEFDLRLVVTLSRELRADLVTQNTDAAPVELTAALHSYFHVGDISQVTIRGLAGTHYIDKVDNGSVKQQVGEIQIQQVTDRIYQATTATCLIDDPALGRTITIEKAGSNSTVVWNPWENARQIADMADDEYHTMVCLETTNAGDDTISLAPGQEHTLSAVIRVSG